MSHRIYISGKITGNPNYMKEFAAAEELLKKTYPDADVSGIHAQVTALKGTFEKIYKECDTEDDGI